MDLRSKKDTGMTIIELLVVISILGIFMGIAVPTVIKSFKVISQVKQITVRYPTARKALARISTMIRQTYPAALASGAPFVGRNASFEAGGIMIPSDEISFPVLDTDYAHLRSTQEISYRLDLIVEGEDSRRGLVERRSFLGAAPGAGIEETIAGRIIGLDFRYLDDSTEPSRWVETWPPASPQEVDAAQVAMQTAGLPAAVKITIFILGGISPQPKSFTTVVNIPSRPIAAGEILREKRG